MFCQGLLKPCFVTTNIAFSSFYFPSPETFFNRVLLLPSVIIVFEFEENVISNLRGSQMAPLIWNDALPHKFSKMYVCIGAFPRISLRAGSFTTLRKVRISSGTYNENWITTLVRDVLITWSRPVHLFSSVFFSPLERGRNKRWKDVWLMLNEGFEGALYRCRISWKPLNVCGWLMVLEGRLISDFWKIGGNFYCKMFHHFFFFWEQDGGRYTVRDCRT